MTSRIGCVKESIEKALNDEKQPWTKWFTLVEQKTGVSRIQLFIGLVAFVAIYLVVGYGSQLLCNFIGFVYPAYCSMKAIETKQKDDDTKWLTYWVVFAFFSIFEYFSNTITHWIPVYWLLKCCLLIWCFLPIENNGSVFLYYKYIRPRFLQHQGDVDHLLDNIANRGVDALLNKAKNIAAGAKVE